MYIPVDLSGYDYYQIEIPPNSKEEELIGDGKFSIHNYDMHKKIISKGRNY